MNFAASVQDDNQLYFDDENQEGIIAPPMYVVALTWPIIENLKDFIQAENFPFSVLNTMVHYTEHIKIFRLIRPKDSLIIKGEIAAIMPHRAGTYVVLRLEAYDLNNSPLFTEHIGAILRRVKLEGKEAGKESIPLIENTSTGYSFIWEKKIEIDKLRSYIYDGCTDITFAIHTSKKFAHFVGLPGIILQGTATLAYAVKELINRESDGNPKKVEEICCKFTNMVFPGSVIKLNIIKKQKVRDKLKVYFNVHNSEGKRAISDGLVVFKDY